MLFSGAVGVDRARSRENIAMPATIAASTNNVAVIAAQRTRALCFLWAWNFLGSRAIA